MCRVERTQKRLIFFLIFNFNFLIGLKYEHRTSGKRVKAIMMKVSAIVADKVKAILPNKFGVIFDGWSSDGNHMVAIYAVFPSLLNPDFAQEILLSCQPLLEEADLSANSYQELLESTMILYGKTLANIQFLVGDNCSVNRCLADYF